MKRWTWRLLPLALLCITCRENQHDRLGHITALSRIEEDKYVWLDRFTIRNLELISSPHENATTLIQIMDQTKTPMGGRLMKRWMVLPLKDLTPIQNRLDAVEAFLRTKIAPMN